MLGFLQVCKVAKVFSFKQAKNQAYYTCEIVNKLINSPKP